jgi:O-acetyl-ADP-ribose deacetylase (regulator of RNase III)
MVAEEGGARIAVMDTSVLINLLHVDGLPLLVELPGFGFVIPGEVLAEIQRPGQRERLQQALAEESLRLEPLSTTEELSVYAELRERLGQGEAACLAKAECLLRGSPVGGRAAGRVAAPRLRAVSWKRNRGNSTMPGRLICSEDFPGGKRFEVAIYDLLAEPTDAIVNAANGRLSHGGGVALEISRAAGSALDEDSERVVEQHGVIPVGGAVVTTAGKLPFKGVVHAVGPRMGDGNEEESIVKALWSSFLRVQERGWASVSFPAISAGIFAVPADVCARAYVRAVRKFWCDHPESCVRLIRLVLFEGPLVKAVEELM